MRSGSFVPWTCAALGAGLALCTVAVVDLRLRTGSLESRPAGEPERVTALERRIDELTTQIANSETAIRDLSRASARARELQRGIAELEAGLREAACRIDEQRVLAARLEDLEFTAGPLVLEERLAGLASSIDARWREVEALAARADTVAGAARDGVETVARELEHDPDALWHDLLAPTVQVSGEETVGTGVILAADPIAGGDDATYVLTAWHVVRDLHIDPDAPTPPIPVTVYTPGGRTRDEVAHLVEHDADLDVALLRFEPGRRFDARARLAPRQRLGAVRVFDRIYAVGCPLGNDPIPTYGEIADTDHLVDGQGYWMVSAPTYIGNSGGGIFDAETHELLALFTKIYTHGTVRPMVVPHMGLATPIHVVYSWLDRIGFAALGPDGKSTRTAGAAR
jgi:uncharacterized coiled-coil protein SlyX